MGIKIEYYILVTGLMNSGKSTLISEYLHSHETREFNPPPIKVVYQGLNFEFLDSVFAIEENENNYNFYELDAPTISKWFQFIEVANAVVIVYNDKPTVQYGSHDSLSEAVFSHVNDSTPIIFVINNYDDLDEATEVMRKKYNLSNYNEKNIIITSVEKGQAFFDKKYGNRVKLKIEELEKMILVITRSLSEK
ncbi:MAG: hypothetical protein HeimC2_30420 [Candidatus Heimdallarchaeota archaeon LC_2]|nr:MAG: hypothetical protein HeimC2_30420 [Candidatus Heimdallarchaeota archaeon LC_2]